MNNIMKRETTFLEHRNECLEVLRVVKRAGGFHVEQFNPETGAHFQDWPGPFNSARAAELFRQDLAGAAAEGSPGKACMSYGIFEAYEELAQSETKQTTTPWADALRGAGVRAGIREGNI